MGHFGAHQALRAGTRLSLFSYTSQRAEGPLLTSDITRAEVLCTLYHKKHAGDLAAGAAKVLFARFLADADAERIALIPNSLEATEKAHRLIQQAYSQPQPLLLRSLDVIHVASALTARATTLVATDTRLREVAELLGLEVVRQKAYKLEVYVPVAFLDIILDALHEVGAGRIGTYKYCFAVGEARGF